MTGKQMTDERSRREPSAVSIPETSQNRLLPREDSARKLASLKGIILKKADEEREMILDSARREAGSWLETQNAELERMVEQIHADAVKRAEEIAKRQIAGAEATRAKERLRLQNSLLGEAEAMLQKELTALRERPDYLGILAGAALSAAENLPEGAEVRVALAGEDGPLGAALIERLSSKRPGLSFEFDPEPAPVTGGVHLSAPDGSWRAAADWHEIVGSLKDELAGRLLAAL
jgi:V/A-type H+-transporting ATPase subunit E